MDYYPKVNNCSELCLSVFFRNNTQIYYIMLCVAHIHKQTSRCGNGMEWSNDICCLCKKIACTNSNQINYIQLNHNRIRTTGGQNK